MIHAPSNLNLEISDKERYPYPVMKAIARCTCGRRSIASLQCQPEQLYNETFFNTVQQSLVELATLTQNDHIDQRNSLRKDDCITE